MWKWTVLVRNSLLFKKKKSLSQLCICNPSRPTCCHSCHYHSLGFVLWKVSGREKLCGDLLSVWYYQQSVNVSRTNLWEDSCATLCTSCIWLEWLRSPGGGSNAPSLKAGLLCLTCALLHLVRLWAIDHPPSRGCRVWQLWMGLLTWRAGNYSQGAKGHA